MAVGLLLTLLIVLAVALFGSSVDTRRTVRLEPSISGQAEYQMRCEHVMSVAINELHRQTQRLPIVQSALPPTPNPIGPARRDCSSWLDLS